VLTENSPPMLHGASLGIVVAQVEVDIARSEIEDIGHASRLLGHSKEEMTKKVYRHVGEIVNPTK